MENVLRSLKTAEEAAAQVEEDAKQKASKLMAKAEDISRKREVESETQAKAIGEKLKSERLEAATKEANEIKEKTKSSASQIEEKAKKNMQIGVDEVVKTLISRMKTMD